MQKGLGDASYLGARRVFNQLDDFAANHHRVGHLGNGFGGGAVADAKAHAHRRLDVRPDARQHGGHGTLDLG